MATVATAGLGRPSAARDVGVVAGMLAIVYGTRPEAIKLRPLTLELARRGIPFTTLFTGQHPDLIAGTGLESPDVSLGVPGRNEPLAYVDDVVTALYQYASVGPRLGRIVVQGDTASALAGARFGAYSGIPVAHVEAGLRSFDPKDPWPEEMFRVEIDQLATLRFAPTITSMGNLLAENLQHGSSCTGNTITDHLRLAGIAGQAERHDLVLVTLHRRESFGQPLRDIVAGLSQFARAHPGIRFVWPLHPNPHVRESLGTLPDNIIVDPPMSAVPFARALSQARAVLTDSGGVIEEACTLGTPCVIARDRTERPEAVSVGNAAVAGRTSRGVVDGLTWALLATIQPSRVFGDGYASERIADLLEAS